MVSIKMSGPVPKSLLSSDPDTTVLKDKSILITGAAQGFGQVVAQSCAAAGAYVTIADLQEVVGKKLCLELQSQGYKANFVQCDVTKWDDQVQAFKSAVRFSPTGNILNHVVINAGVMDKPLYTAADEPLKSLDENPEEPDATPIEVNTRGALYTFRLAQLYLTMASTAVSEPGSKSILFVLSPESFITLPGSLIYGASKFGARGLFRGCRVAMAAMGIRVNAIIPWLMETPMNVGGPFGNILTGLGINYISLDAHVKVATHLLCGNEIAGRAVALGQPEGVIVDVEDDVEGGDGSKQYWGILRPDWLPKIYALLGFQVNERDACF